MTLPTPVGAEDHVAAVARKRRRLRLILVFLTVVAASAMLAWGYLGYFTDVLVLRRTPIRTLASPSGVRELRVYEVAAGGEHTGVWLATVAPAAGSDAEQRKVYYGNEVTFSWLDDVTLLAREYPTDMPAVEHRIDVIHDSYGVEDRYFSDEHGLDVVFALMWLAFPVGFVVLFGVAATVIVPRLVWRDRSVPSVTASPAAGMEPYRDV